MYWTAGTKTRTLRVPFAEMLKSDMTVYRKLVDAGAPVKMVDGRVERWDVESYEDRTYGFWVFSWREE